MGSRRPECFVIINRYFSPASSRNMFLHATPKKVSKCGGARYGKKGAGGFILRGDIEGLLGLRGNEGPRVECGLNFDSSGGGGGRHEEVQEGGEENTNFLLVYAFTLLGAILVLVLVGW